MSNKSQIYSNFELVSLSEVLTQRKKNIIIDNAKTYKRCRVQTRGQGVILRDEVLGKEIKTKKQQVCKEDDFLVAEIDAKVGGYGIVPSHLEDAIVSGHYFLFEIDKTKLIPDFLSILVKCNDFSKQVKATGSTNYAAIRPYHVLEYLIPVPSIAEQNRIVEAYNTKIRLAEEQEQKAKELEDGIDKFLFNELGIVISPEKQSIKGMQLIAFSLSSRWDTQFLIGNLPSFTSKFDLVKFSDIIYCFNKDIEGNSIRINSTSFPNVDFRFIGMENIEKETGNLLQFQNVKGKEVKSQTLRVPNGFVLFGKLRPYLNKYWKNDTDFDNIICSSEFFVFDIELNLNKDFFIYMLSSEIIQNQISDKTSGARMPRINEDIFYNLKIPIPPIELQNSISESIDKIKNQLNDLKIKATENRVLAIKEFENEIFKPCN